MNLRWRRIHLPHNWNNVLKWICHMDKIHGSKWNAICITYIYHWMGCNVQIPNWNVMLLYVKCKNSDTTIFMMMQSGNLCSNKFKWFGLRPKKIPLHSISTRAISVKITKSTFVFRHFAYPMWKYGFWHSNHLHSDEEDWLTYSLIKYHVHMCSCVQFTRHSSWSDEWREW